MIAPQRTGPGHLGPPWARLGRGRPWHLVDESKARYGALGLHHRYPASLCGVALDYEYSSAHVTFRTSIHLSDKTCGRCERESRRLLAS